MKFFITKQRSFNKSTHKQKGFSKQQFTLYPTLCCSLPDRHTLTTHWNSGYCSNIAPFGQQIYFHNYLLNQKNDKPKEAHSSSALYKCLKAFCETQGTTISMQFRSRCHTLLSHEVTVSRCCRGTGILVRLVITVELPPCPRSMCTSREAKRRGCCIPSDDCKWTHL